MYTYSYVCICTIDTMNITWKKAKAVSKDLKTVLLIETSTQSVSSVSHLHPLRTWSSLLHLITIAGFLLSMLLDVATWWIDVDRWAIFLLSYLQIDLHGFTFIPGCTCVFLRGDGAMALLMRARHEEDDGQLRTARVLCGQVHLQRAPLCAV